MDLVFVGFTGFLLFWQLCLCCPSSSSCAAAIVLVFKAFRGMLESLDFFTNTQMISVAVLCDDQIGDEYVAAYKKVWPFGYLAPLVEKAHLWGILLCAVVFRRTFMMWHAYSEGKNSFSMLSRLTGMHAFRHVLGADHVYAAASEDMIFALAHFFTDIPILYLQTSLFAFTFDYTGSEFSLAKLEMLASIALSLYSMMQACLGAVSIKAFKQLGSKVSLMPVAVFMLVSAILLRAYSPTSARITSGQSSAAASGTKIGQAQGSTQSSRRASFERCRTSRTPPRSALSTRRTLVAN
jgi:hypothetical protein